MSEELQQISPKPLGRFLYYRIGSTTLSQLKAEKVISTNFSKDIASKKPDGLIVLPGGVVKAIIEYKTKDELNTDKKIQKAIGQEIEVAKQLCKLLIVTTGEKTIWINAKNGERITSETGFELEKIFDAQPIENGSIFGEDISELEALIDKIDQSINLKNSKISPPKTLNPFQLARTIWQKIWINTGKDPEKCLYNVVELFVFKFLSDVGVLGKHNNFDSVHKLIDGAGPREALKQYANICRKKIQELFPEGADKTTIINGTIFVNEKGDPNQVHAHLFGEILEDLQKYHESFGSFQNINKEFKTRLYESFLRETAGIKTQGQYFTPRNVVKSMVHMSDAPNLKSGSRVCDPFCGVGGFLMELISENDHILKEFVPKGGKVNPRIHLMGYDKGSDEKEEERTIILAKANMLIYFSDLLVKYHSESHLKGFSEGAFNKVFHLLRTDLGTFEHIEDEPYDLILTNPPYVTSGFSSMKKNIKNRGLSSYYDFVGKGKEGLALEWIIKNLKPNGQALVVVPFGILHHDSMIGYLKKHCIIEGVISLPTKTFYSTPQKTFILAMRKKQDDTEKQCVPIFTYLVSEIGETRDTYRWPTKNNNLDEMVSLFNQFKNAKSSFKSSSKRCKIINFDEFDKKPNWLIYQWWTLNDRENLGERLVNKRVKRKDFFDNVDTISQLAEDLKKENSDLSISKLKYKKILLGDSSFFEFIPEKTGWAKEDFIEIDTANKSDYPVYSASRGPVAFVKSVNDKLIKINGDTYFSFASNGEGSGENFVIHKKDFYVSNDRTVVRIKDNLLVCEYVVYALRNMKDCYEFSFFYKAAEKNVLSVSIPIPISNTGDFSVVIQEEISKKFLQITKLQKEASRLINGMDKSIIPIKQFIAKSGS